MDRRQFLASAVIPVGIATAGCSLAPGQTVDLHAETERQDGGRQNETYLVYRHDGEEVRVVGFDQHSFPASLDDRFGFGLVIEYDEATTVDAVRVDLRAPPTGEPADIYLAAPRERWPNLTYGRVDGDGATRIALPEAGAVIDETVFLNTIVDPNAAPVERIAIDLEMELGARNSPVTYRAATTTAFEVAAREDSRPTANTTENSS